ncbi:unnamed protein product [Heligmosomoides polygyrus]|uniref:Uncharacterized protein n=1 Tax=Heligmosomoides polygyrus TaxID=6339 RepID=A0A183FHE1_HELPZ|nr:unnamed protein product [Heligmosomoides polygyrus]
MSIRCSFAPSEVERPTVLDDDEVLHFSAEVGDGQGPDAVGWPASFRLSHSVEVCLEDVSWAVLSRGSKGCSQLAD